MTEPGSRQRPWAAAANSWRAFWFQTQPAYTVGLVRMAFGAVAVGWTVSLRPDLYELFGPRGVQPRQPGGGFQWGFSHSGPATARYFSGGRCCSFRRSW
ncbi:hypothetical protein I553_2604 [Mycobacterium xenopi 4042]|uniref:Uncharacterized protein n=1 Tax=Mycobacterium xenopi 4042 TaxID=1299334 RepID=X8C7T4_MYCXE|nr:hypothetical protein I553_2604 [Mycobacterium xenopi 4042]